MTEKAKPKTAQRYVKEAVVRALHNSDQAIANVVLDATKEYTVAEAQSAVDKWKKGEIK